MREIFKRLIIDSQERVFEGIVKREYDIPLDSDKIVSLIGIRRCGKTTIMFELINTLRKDIAKERIFYINFEDDRLFPVTVKDLDDLIEGYYELYPHNRDKKVYIFLDEVQNIKDWELFVRRVYDNLNVQIFITGSSSKLLSSEIATSLRGRTITYEIFPFSFKEYLRYKNIEINLYSSKSISFIKNAFNSYLKEGGFVETFDKPKDIQRKILKDYMDLIIYKDLVDRYAIKNQALLKHLIKYLFVNMGTLISFNKLYNEYKSMGYRVSKDTLYDYMEHLQDAYIAFTSPIFRNSVKEEQRNPKKIWVIDNGFKSLFSANLSEDYSKLYENLAFLHLRRKEQEIYYYKGNQEVDLYSNGTLANVSFDINNPKTLQREVDALIEAMEYFNLKKSYLLTQDREEVIELSGKEIIVTPMWKWLLNE